MVIANLKVTQLERRDLLGERENVVEDEVKMFLLQTGNLVRTVVQW